MAGILDTIKGAFGSAKSKAGEKTPDSVKEKAGDVKDKVDDLVDKAGEKMPDSVKKTYGKVSDKVESLIPGSDGDEAAGEGDEAAGEAPAEGDATA